MALIRPRSSSQLSPAVTIANPAVQAALRTWSERTEAARTQGEQAGKLAAAAELNEAKRLRAEADQHVAQAKQQAQQQIAREREAMRQQLGEVLAAFQTMIADRERTRATALQQAEGDVVALACALAARLVQHEVETNPNWARELLAEALRQVPLASTARLLIHPEDRKAVEQCLGAALAISGHDGDAVTLVENPNQTRGALHLEAAGTLVDCGVDGGWSRLVERLRAQAPDGRWQLETQGTAESTHRVMHEVYQAAERLETTENTETENEETTPSAAKGPGHDQPR